MNKLKLVTVAVVFAALTLSSCSTTNKTIREPNTRVEFYKNDFSFSSQVTGQAESTRIFGVDWARLIKKEMGTVSNPASPIPIDIASLPVIGSYVVDLTANYALYDMMSKNPGYDVIFYPQYETTVKKPIIGLGFIMKTTNVKATARLGKIN